MAAEFAYDFYDFSEFDNTATAAPQREEKQEQKPELKVLKREKQNVAAGELTAAKSVAKFFAVMVSFVVMFSVVCSSFAAVKSAQYSKIEAEAQMKIYNNKFLEKSAELNALVTPEEIAKNAVEKLGMIKVSDENKFYASAQTEDVVVAPLSK